MAKKKDKKAKGKKGSGAADTVEAVRSAVERALPDGSKERGSQIVDEVARAVTRVRESLEEHGILDDLKGLRTEIEGLARRVAALERPGTTASAKPAATRTTTKRAASKRATASRSTKTAASSRSATKRSSSRSTTKKPSSSRSTAKRSTTRKAASSRGRTKRTSSTKKPSSSS